ncbi:MAG: hypothetical protein K6F50_01480 [Kiritimatiellae bacterium]|nr:hypothetical protein [Kiritimatiellia bacterium]
MIRSPFFAAALAVLVALCHGCRERDESPGVDSAAVGPVELERTESERPEPSAGGATREPASKRKLLAVDRPLVADGCDGYAVYNRTSSPALYPLRDALRRRLASVVNSNPEMADGFLAAAGMKGSDVRWGVLAVGRVGEAAARKDGRDMPDWSLAIAFPHDVSAVVSALSAASGVNSVSEPEELPDYGVDVWEVELSARAVGGSMFVSSMDGELLVVASSRAIAERELSLYSARSSAATVVETGGSALFTVTVADFGRLLKSMDRYGSEIFNLANLFIPDARNALFGLGECKLSFSGDGDVAGAALSIETPRGEQLAETIAQAISDRILPALRSPQMRDALGKGDSPTFAYVVDNLRVVAKEGMEVELYLPFTKDVIDAAADILAGEADEK